MSRDWRVPPEWIEASLRVHDLDAAGAAGLYRAVAREDGIERWRPQSMLSVDPRTGIRTVYSPARGRRPHDQAMPPPAPEPSSCIVCKGLTTGVVDVAPLSVGSTFVNMNLFPVVYPGEEGALKELSPDFDSGAVSGVHLLQWVSTEHAVDLHNMPEEDLAVVVERLGVLESLLYRSERAGMPEVAPGQRGHVGVIKNVGRLVGGSVVHGHQQILHTNVRPGALEADASYLRRTGEPFAATMARSTPEDLVVREYEGLFRTVVPWFMLRPLQMLVVPTGEGFLPRDLENLDDRARLAFARALGDATAAVVALMPEMGRELAYNLVVHNGIAEGLYAEIHPYTQERGGYEWLGLSLCEETPETSASRIRGFLDRQRTAAGGRDRMRDGEWDTGATPG